MRTLIAAMTAAALFTPTAPALDTGALDQAVDAVRAAGAPSVLVEVRAGEQAYTAARGPRALGTAAPARPTDRFRIASITKSMVSTVVLQLAEEGRLALDDPIGRYLPGVLPYPKPITVEQLLGHTSGLREYIKDIYPSTERGSAEDVRTNRYLRFTPRQLVELATRGPLLFEPGTSFSYSNVNYVLLGMLVENLTGRSAAHEVERRVLHRAGMRDSYVARTNPRILGPHPHGYYATGDPAHPLLDSTDLSPTQFWTAGFVISTVDDVNRFYRAMFDGTLLPPELAERARAFTPVWRGKYGLGVLGLDLPPDCAAVPGGVAYGHTGGALGHTTFAFGSPDGRRQLTVTYSVDSTLDTKRAERIERAVRELGGTALCG